MTVKYAKCVISFMENRKAIQVEVFWAVTLCNDAAECQHFRGSCCLHLYGEVTGEMS
jgi:hypothetical protein